MSDHPQPHLLEALAAGRLEGPEAEALVEHLDVCNDCLDLAEGLWQGVGSLPDEGEVPAMSAESRSKIEERLFRRIRSAAAGSELAWLVTGGFLSVILCLLRPLLATDRLPETERGRTT